MAAMSTFLHAQKASDLRTRLQSAASASVIDADGLAPWHLKLDIQLFDEKGKSIEQGSIEEWWKEPRVWRISYSFPSYKGTELHNADGIYRSKEFKAGAPLVDDLLEQVVHPIVLEDVDQGTPDLRKLKFGKVDLDCIMLDQPLKNVAFPPLGLFPTYCLDAGRDTFRMMLDTGSLIFVRNREGGFQKRSVPIDVTAVSASVDVGKAHLSTLATYTPTPDQFAPGGEMESVSDQAAEVAPSVAAGQALSQVRPIYPAASKRNRIQGRVELKARIGRDGRIRSLRVISTPDSDLAMAAIAAVSKWTYKPYMLKGIPVEVDTHIEVNFAFGPG